MDISILTTNPDHPVVEELKNWRESIISLGHTVSIFFDKTELIGGDILFMVSCAQLINEADKNKFKSTLVLHASDLPKGRGWSPHIWSILEGNNTITLCLLEASEPVDSGRIWFKTSFNLSGHELLPEINEKLFAAELYLMEIAIAEFNQISPQEQQGDSGKYLKKRTVEDSKLDIDKSIAEQFNLLRVVDNTRYPAFIEYLGFKYAIRIEKIRNVK